MALTYVRYYFNKLDNIQREELVDLLGISIETLYRRLKTGGNSMTLLEAQIFCEYCERALNCTIRMELLTKEIQLKEEEL